VCSNRRNEVRDGIFAASSSSQAAAKRGERSGARESQSAPMQQRRLHDEIPRFSSESPIEWVDQWVSLRESAKTRPNGGPCGFFF
jgi:hypothetical protein